ncbi:MAG: hypothetical protein RBQ99_07255 [Trichlorobacter sp.]|nr:hypothetical protein [Trichlorobacter sp.]
MNENGVEAAKTFTESVDNLFSEITSWVADTNLHTTLQPTEISEETTGKYRINKLTLADTNGKMVAELVPVGAFVIGASGRINLNGKIDDAILLKLDAGGPAMDIETTVAGVTESKTVPFFRNVKESGWYWIESSRLGRANLLTKELFAELLWGVSEYALT